MIDGETAGGLRITHTIFRGNSAAQQSVAIAGMCAHTPRHDHSQGLTNFLPRCACAAACTRTDFTCLELSLCHFMTSGSSYAGIYKLIVGGDGTVRYDNCPGGTWASALSAAVLPFFGCPGSCAKGRPGTHVQFRACACPRYIPHARDCSR